MGRLIVDGRSCNVLRDLVEHARLVGVEVLVLSHFGLKLYEKHPGAFYDMERGCAVGAFSVERIEVAVDSESAARPLWWIVEDGDVVVADDVLIAATGIWNGAAAVSFRGKVFEPEKMDGLLERREAYRRDHVYALDPLPKIDRDSVARLLDSVDDMIGAGITEADRAGGRERGFDGKIFVDADNVPLPPVLAIARKRGLPVCAAYNEIMHVEKQLLLSDPTSEGDAVAGFWVELSPQPHEKDSADRWILERVVAGDVVLTTDVPLMWSCIERGATVIDRLGCSYEPDDLGYFRDVDQMRASHSMRFSCVKKTTSKPQRALALMARLDECLLGAS